jgi:hypothetical protein
MKSLRAAPIRPALCAVVLASLFAAGTAQAAPDARASAEIDQLLGAIASSGCTFVRSGKEYSAAQARKHLEFKLGFVRSRIDSADEFIRDLASASSTTGEAYHMRCAGTDTTTRPWLDAQLKLIRHQR